LTPVLNAAIIIKYIAKNDKGRFCILRKTSIFQNGRLFMKKIAQAIVRLRKMILILAVLLLVPSAVGAIATRINYDILSYLPPELDIE